jgi:hypothetical protein
MTRHGRTKLVPPKQEPKNQALETLETPSVRELKEEEVPTELDMEMECPRCHEIMDLQSNFDKLMYSCEGCSFLLKCV